MVIRFDFPQSTKRSDTFFQRFFSIVCQCRDRGLLIKLIIKGVDFDNFSPTGTIQFIPVFPSSQTSDAPECTSEAAYNDVSMSR